MRAGVALLILAVAVAGCTGAPPAKPGNGSTGSGSTAEGFDPASTGGAAGGTSGGAAAGSGSGDWHNPANPVLVWTTTMGTFKAQLFLDKAPITAGNFLNLTRQGFYDGARFHRVIKDFMIQDGDPLSKDPAQQSRWGTGGSGTNIRDEFPCKDGTTSYAHQRTTGTKPCSANGGLLFTHDVPGLLSMANAGPNSGSSQYFVTVAKTDWLDGQHAIFGRVVSGYDVVEAISKVPTRPGDRPATDVVIQTLRVDGA